MEGMKLIDASEVITSKKASKIEKKKQKSTMKIITDEGKKDTVGDTSEDDIVSKPFTLKPDITVKGPDVIKSDIVKTDIVGKNDTILKTNIGDKTIRAIKLKEEIYYGPKNTNKNRFMRMYKKLGLKWIEGVSLNGVMVDGWFNDDKSQYIIKLLEDGGFKRFKFYGCDEIYDYFVDLGGFAFDYNKEDLLSPNYLNNKANNEAKVGNNVNSTARIGDTGDDSKFIGADLWSRRRIRQLLKNMPDNWGVLWK